jgi:glycerophosphoryl diester phosphodiesterase
MLIDHGRVDDVIVASFNDRSTEVFSTFAPSVATSPGTTALTMFIQALRSGSPIDRSICRHSALQVPFRIGGIDLIDERFVTTAHDLGLAVHVWTVDDEADMARLVALGVDGILTNVPSTLSGVLERLGATWRH